MAGAMSTGHAVFIMPWLEDLAGAFCFPLFAMTSAGSGEPDARGEPQFFCTFGVQAPCLSSA